MCELNTEYNWERIRIIESRQDDEHEVPGRINAAPQGGWIKALVGELVEEVEGLESQEAEVMDKLVSLTSKELRNQNGGAVNDNIQGDVRNVIVNNDRRGCTYKEFLACHVKEYDSKGGVIVYAHWIKKIESVQDTSGCGNDQKVKYTAGSFVGKAFTWYHELARLVPHLVTPENRRIERNGSLKRNPEMRGNSEEPSRDRNGKDDNKRTRTGNAFATTANPMRREMVNPVNARNPTAAHGACFECGGTDYYKAACPRLNQAQRPGGNRPNQAMDNNEGQCADYSFVSTTFIPLLGIEPGNLGFNYEIKIASGQLVEINKVIRGYKLEIEGHVFDIDLIPFSHGSFDMIIGMDWLSKHKAEIVCHKKVVRIPLQKGKVLRVIGERPEEKMRHLMSAKAKEQKQEEIVVVRDFLK
ncbi:putative reverse transcriptase domain-containing protein, partial [Tanacetum coccineum]